MTLLCYVYTMFPTATATTDRLNFLNSLKFVGALAECPELLKAFSRSITVFTL